MVFCCTLRKRSTIDKSRGLRNTLVYYCTTHTQILHTVQKHCKETPQVAMSSSKTDSSTNKRQKNPEIKIVDTSFGRFKITEETKDTEEDHPNNHDPNVIKKDVKNPLRIRLEYK